MNEESCIGCEGGKALDDYALSQGMATRAVVIDDGVEAKDVARCPKCGTNYQVIPLGVNREERRKLHKRAK